MKQYDFSGNIKKADGTDLVEHQKMNQVTGEIFGGNPVSKARILTEFLQGKTEVLDAHKAMSIARQASSEKNIIYLDDIDKEKLEKALEKLQSPNFENLFKITLLECLKEGKALENKAEAGA
jgi:hypothetical protein